MADTISQLIGRHPLLEGLPAADLEQVAGCSHNVVADEGRILFVEGEPATCLYLIRRGQVSLEIHSPGRGPVVIETMGPSSVVGWSWLFRPYRWSFTGRVTSPLAAVAVDGGCLRAKAEADHDLGFILMRRFAGLMLERLQATRIRLLDLYGDGSSR